MKKLIALAVFLIPAPALAQDAIMDRLARIEQTNASITSMLARQKDDLANLQTDVRALTAEVKALRTGGTVSRDWAGDPVVRGGTGAWSAPSAMS